MPLFNAFASVLALVAVALPFLFAHTQAPLSNFWPQMASAACALVLAGMAVGAAQAQPARGGLRRWAGWVLAGGLLLAAVLASVVGLVQFFWGDVGASPFIYPSTPGLALGNLRQRNQQASLLAMGAWSLAWTMGRLQAALPAIRRPAVAVAAGVLAAWALVLISAADAATASRTGILEWGVMLGLLVLWRRSLGVFPLAFAATGAMLYALAAWLLPWMLEHWMGVQMDGLFQRLADEGQGCVSRKVLWSNMLHLIAQKPFTGWGWGEMAYAHYATLFPGERFCVLLDNAHNLPLHLAVELGLPITALLCALALWGVWRLSPWRETDPVRQLAWGVLAIVGVHSLLEFPLWYGPFQLATVFALLLLVRRERTGPPLRPGRVGMGAAALACGAALALGGLLVRDYERVSQLYRAVPERDPDYREDTARKVLASIAFFRETAHFATVTTTPVTAQNAAEIHPQATRLLHYSPEPRVIEAVLASAALLGRQAEVDFHTVRYRVAYPQEYARWAASHPQGGSAGAAPPASAAAP
ncbi:Wzy polymerase domain-containing protein [Acidovorax sp. SUPP3334]|uniref:PglL family O-oligosaccharyltransferase n=1 Tax=Acidovorax sp. SUPP3334 TaxID=2920881 RepID=UPI0023DE2CA9|nr:Wzy polymerase domain-containing protein [Acidovorax sp. SUPP3334]GKT23978.1 Wzy polymerase domain-containing protein [Acidovorax sp. SUPP3334]